MAELIYKELSYELVGFAYDIDNSIGYGHQEKVYGDAFANLLSKSNLEYEREKYVPIKIAENLISKRYVDFLIDGKVIIELKTGNFQYKAVFNQMNQYLIALDLKLGLIIRFSKTGVQVKRVLNIRN